MTRLCDSTVYIIDDDTSVREAMAWLLRSPRRVSESFDIAEDFERMLDGLPSGAVHPTRTGCILLDVCMPDMSGMALLDCLVGRGITKAWPVIFLTGHADVPTEVNTVKRGVIDRIIRFSTPGPSPMGPTA